MTANTSPLYESPPFRGLWSKQRSCSQPAASVHKRSLIFIECGLVISLLRVRVVGKRVSKIVGPSVCAFEELENA